MGRLSPGDLLVPTLSSARNFVEAMQRSDACRHRFNVNRPRHPGFACCRDAWLPLSMYTSSCAAGGLPLIFAGTNLHHLAWRRRGSFEDDMAVAARITTRVLRTVRTFAGPLRNHASTRTGLTTLSANHVVMPYIHHAGGIVTQRTLMVVGLAFLVDDIDLVLI